MLIYESAIWSLFPRKQGAYDPFVSAPPPLPYKYPVLWKASSGLVGAFISVRKGNRKRTVIAIFLQEYVGLGQGGDMFKIFIMTMEWVSSVYLKGFTHSLLCVVFAASQKQAKY